METLPLTPKILVAAYANGIFPMDVEGVIQWFSPDPRSIIELDSFHTSKNLARRYRSGRYEIRINTCFHDVIWFCADRPEGTWISEEIVEAYTRLHTLGYAHSVESWHRDELAGGLYGVSIGGAFFGESMFTRQTDAGKVALVALVERMKARGFALLDVQFTTAHLEQFGAIVIPRAEYLNRLNNALKLPVTFVD